MTNIFAVIVKTETCLTHFHQSAWP